MSNPRGIAALFPDIGGVLLTNGWDRRMRQRAAQAFGLAFDEMNERHNLTFDTYERAVNIDDRLLFVEVARGFGLHSIYHETVDPTRAALEQLGLT